MEPITPQETDKVFAFLAEHAQADFLSAPIKKISELLLESFGWPISHGRKRAVAIVESLERSRLIDYEYKDDKISKGLKIKVLSSDSHPSSAVRLVKPEKPEEEIEKTTETLQENLFLPEPEKIRRKFKVLRKGVARNRRKSEEIGDKNESRLHRLVQQLANILTREFSKTIQRAVCTRSGRHNPKKGKIDLQDSAGNDVDLWLNVRDGEGRTSSRWLIWDSKSSRMAAVKFNRKIIYFPGQAGADLKKAIVVNKYRSDKEIIAELASDLISIGLITEDMKNKVLEFVSDF